MNTLAYISIYGWIPLVFYLFSKFPAQRAVVISVIAAWLFLPQANIPLSGIPNLTKMSVTCYGVLIASVCFDVRRLQKFRVGWIDIPMIIWCLCSLASSLSNDLGLYDGLSQTLSQTVTWGFPYFLGRIYFNTLQGLRQFALGIFIGGLAYIPLCLYEVRMSPQLHQQIYGWFPHSFIQTYRLGGFRPQVFMQHGLMVGVWMMTATLVGIWLWQAKLLKPIFGIPVPWLIGGLFLTFILVRSTGAYLLFVLGLLILFTAHRFHTSLPLLIVILIIPFYLQTTVTGNFTEQQQTAVVSFIAENIEEERAESLQFRFNSENLLIEKAQQRMLLGWGGWGRNRVYAEDWQGDLVDITTTDSLWIIVFGDRGLVGLISLFSTLLLPVLIFVVYRYPARTWLHPQVAPAAVLAVTLILYTFDCLLNAMVNPIFALITGGLSGLVLQEKQKQRIATARKTVVSKKALVSK